MGESWFILRNDKKYGPYPPAQMEQMADSGQLLPTDMIMQEGMNEWLPCSQARAMLQATGGADRATPSPAGCDGEAGVVLSERR